MNTNAYIYHISYFLPDFVENNIDLENEFPGRIDADLLKKIGVSSRRIATNGLRASQMGTMVGEQLFTETGFDKSKIDALVYCSLNHDYITPATSCLIQKELGLSNNVATFDLNHGCSGYIYCLALAKSIMQTLNMHNVLIITSTAPTKYVHPKNLSIRLLFGDASSATLLSTAPDEGKVGIGEFVLGTDGTGYKKIIIRDGMDANSLWFWPPLKKKQTSLETFIPIVVLIWMAREPFYLLLKRFRRSLKKLYKKTTLTKTILTCMFYTRQIIWL